MKLSTPFNDLLPPLSSDEFAALKSDIAANGILHPVIVDEEGQILDGHHRYKIDKNAPVRVVKGLSHEEKQAFVMRCNLHRRNLSHDQRKEVLVKQKRLAKKLRNDDPKRWTQAALGKLFGVSRSSVESWFIRNDSSVKTHNPDARVKLNTAAKAQIVSRINDGETQEQVAADFGVTQATVSRVIKAADAVHSRSDDKKRKTAHLVSSVFEVRRGDFRKVLADIEGASLILTDPPYPKDALPLWADLGEWAQRALADDGILIAYSGQMFLPDVMSNLLRHLDYWWCGAVVHAGSGNLTPLGSPVRKVINRWKPLVMFTKRGGAGFGRSFSDLLEGAGKLKENHNWQQPIAEAGVLIEAFTNPGELVVDPFAGSGGFCKAAHELGRIAVGAEILNG